MKVKKYTAPNMQEAMKQIRSELGRDAIILNSREIHKGGLLRFFRKKRIEVIAAIDKERPISRNIHKQELSTYNHSKQITGFQTKREEENLLKEIASIKNMVATIADENKDFGNVPPPFRPLMGRLSQQRIDQRLLDELSDFLLEKYYEHNKNVTDVEGKKYAKQFFSKKLQPYSFGGMSFQKKMVMCLGPTGVGKTTTLAKLAAHAKLDLQKSIAFITTDTYRIGAVEQLKTYAKILDVPLEVCYTSKDFQRAVHRFQTYDMTFIDTAGRNFRYSKNVQELDRIIDSTRDMETYLVFSLTAKEDDMSAIYEQFSNVAIDKLIFTKLDETDHYGSLINIPLKYKKGVAYITTGQDVPDDIMEGTIQTIVNRIVGE
ncbi:flagellar biosynthesis protein FlhF [Fervidibacillus halotolerans]|uniref:Flagellar biosynthesis protein FlhF n=1 Tax=Fervidibacillus halotolerans TaxID=2980027 RepID=A0A9E8M2V8_9BACI|nr:flagellar biosynthesis protein FlhF [Fervidibacillus halotolerans]WAA13586.1 flagellar biosynthesis protein FlhF [Fervidibacillus halotolerans]